MTTTGKIALFVGSALLGSDGFKLLGSKDARKACTQASAAVPDRTKTLGFGDDECNFHLMSRARAEEPGFVPGQEAK